MKGDEIMKKLIQSLLHLAVMLVVWTVGVIFIMTSKK